MLILSQQIWSSDWGHRMEIAYRYKYRGEQFLTLTKVQIATLKRFCVLVFLIVLGLNGPKSVAMQVKGPYPVHSI